MPRNPPRKRLKENGSSGGLRFNPKVSLDPSQVEDLRPLGRARRTYDKVMNEFESFVKIWGLPKGYSYERYEDGSIKVFKRERAKKPRLRKKKFPSSRRS